MKTYHYSHPDWDMTLIVTCDEHKKEAEGALGHDSDPAMLSFTEVEMTEEEVAQLPEFSG